MPSEDDGVFAGLQIHDISLTILAVIGASLAILLLVALFAPPEVGAMFDPATRLFVEVVFGLEVWQIVTILFLAVGTWLLAVDIRNDAE